LQREHFTAQQVELVTKSIHIL